MTNKDLLDAMQYLEAKYTDEADERAEKKYTRQRRKIRLTSAFVALGGTAACFALLFGMGRMNRSGAQFQTGESVLSDVIVEETLPAEADVPEEQTKTEVTAPAETTPKNAAAYSYLPAETTNAVTKETTTVKKVTAPTKTEPAEITNTPAKETTTVKKATTPPKTEPAKTNTFAAQTDLTEKTTQTTASATKIADQTTVAAVQNEATALNEKYTKPTLILDNVTAEAGAVVPVRVVIVNNPGLYTSGVRIYYDAALGVQTHIEEPSTTDLPEKEGNSEQEFPEFLNDPVDFFSRLLGYDVTEEQAAELLEEIKTENSEAWAAWNQNSEQSTAPTDKSTDFSRFFTAPEVKLTTTFGSITELMRISTSFNTDNHVVGYALITNTSSMTEEMTEDGEIITFFFIVPEDAESGTVYKLTPEILEWCDSKTQSYQIDTVDGSITVK